MEKRIVITGPIGSGKSTLLEKHLCPFPPEAGGFLTRRAMDGERLIGFDLYPVAAGCAGNSRFRFLDFSENGPVWDAKVFSRQGRALLLDAARQGFGIFDELGGPELLIPEFSQALEHFWRSGVPAVCVVKSPESAAALSSRSLQPPAYFTALETLWHRLRGDPDTRIVTITRYGDPDAANALGAWRERYGYKNGG